MEEILWIVSAILLIPVFIFALWAQHAVMSRFNKYSSEMSMSGLTGAQLARMLLDRYDCSHVTVERCKRGHLSDHYDPKRKVVALSASVHDSSSLAALGVAAHEVGHAVQDQTGYLPLKIRQLIIRTTRLVNVLLLPLVIIGFLGFFFMFLPISSEVLFWGIISLCIVYALSALINLITLPTEFNASRRAMQMMRDNNVLHDEAEYEGSKKVLSAAALTYVAALAVSLVYLMRFAAFALMLARRR